MRHEEGYFRDLWAALRGQGAVVPAAAGGGDPALRARVAALEMDLAERDQRIGAMRSEYTALQAERERAASGAGQEQLERLFKKLAGPLSNLLALADLAAAGHGADSADVLQLVRSLEKELARAGLERLGSASESTAFDPAIHQRMSGEAVHAKTPVLVRMPGFRMGQKVIQKALVTAREGNRG